MKLYLARHGDYIIDPSHMKDVLSAKGKHDIQQIAHFLKAANLNIQAIYHSGKSRAEETATIYTDLLLPNQHPKIMVGIKPNDDVDLFAEQINLIHQDAILVGHMPFMDKLVSKLISNNSSKSIVQFQTGTIVCLEMHELSHWKINWVLEPGLF